MNSIIEAQEEYFQELSYDISKQLTRQKFIPTIFSHIQKAEQWDAKLKEECEPFPYQWYYNKMVSKVEQNMTEMMERSQFLNTNYPYRSQTVRPLQCK